LQVIRGWDIGVKQLSLGQKAVLHIPHSLAYGDQAVETIPAYSDLDFEVELLEIIRKSLLPAAGSVVPQAWYDFHLNSLPW